MTRIQFIMSLSSTQRAILNNYGRVVVLTQLEQEVMKLELEKKLNESNN